MDEKLSKTFSLLDEVRIYPLVIMFSRGKDSTTVLDIIGRYAVTRGLETPVYIIYNEWVYSHLEVVKKWSTDNNIDFNVITITPPSKKDFFSLVLGKGYALPVVRRHAPWCNKEMKTRPTGRLLKQIMKEKNYENIVYITGGRITESGRRRKSLENLGVYSPLSKIKKEYVGEVYYLAPIYDWKDEDVFNYLRNHNPSIYGDRYDTLLKLYSKYGENGVKLRTGCWICPQVSRDKFLEAYAEERPEYKIVLEAREKIISISENPKYRTAVSKNGYPAGRINLEGRKQIAKVLFDLIKTDVGRELMRDYLDNVPEIKSLIISLAEKD